MPRTVRACPECDKADLRPREAGGWYCGQCSEHLTEEEVVERDEYTCKAKFEDRLRAADPDEVLKQARSANKNDA